MVRVSYVSRCLVLATVVAFFIPQSYAAIVNGTNTNVFVQAQSGPSAFAVGYGSGPSYSSTFNNNFLVNSAGVGTSPAIALTGVPYVNVGGALYFVFGFDSQETNAGRTVQIDKVEILVNNSVIWQTQEAILLNSGTPYTLTPLGNGLDMMLYIPVSIFNNLNLIGSDTFVFRSTLSLQDNGAEEWNFTNLGAGGPIATSTFGPNQSVQSAEPIPEPSTWALTLLGAGLVAFRRRRSK